MNISTFLATYEVEGDIATLTIPLEFVFGEGSDIEVTMTGELVGTASLAAGFAADFNKDRAVDGDDFLIWQQAFGTTSGATSNTGDANGDGAVNGDDFLLWQQEFGAAPPAGDRRRPRAHLARIARRHHGRCRSPQNPAAA